MKKRPEQRLSAEEALSHPALLKLHKHGHIEEAKSPRTPPNRVLRDDMIILKKEHGTNSVYLTQEDKTQTPRGCEKLEEHKFVGLKKIIQMVAGPKKLSRRTSNSLIAFKAADLHTKGIESMLDREESPTKDAIVEEEGHMYFL